MSGECFGINQLLFDIEEEQISRYDHLYILVGMLSQTVTVAYLPQFV